MSNQALTAWCIALVIVIITAIIGWVMNIVCIFSSFDTFSTGEMIVRCLGIVAAPIGAIMGYI